MVAAAGAARFVDSGAYYTNEQQTESNSLSGSSALIATLSLAWRPRRAADDQALEHLLPHLAELAAVRLERAPVQPASGASSITV
jgi:hypothetical protein